MKLVVDVRSLTTPHPSGVGHYIFEMLRALAATDLELILFCTGRHSPMIPNEILSLPNVSLVHRRIPNKILNLGITLNLVRLEPLVRRLFDAVWYPNIGFLPKTTTRTILTVHDLAFHWMPDTYTRWQRLWHRLTKSRAWIRRASTIIAISESTKRDVVNLRGNNKNVVTILHGIDHEAFTSRVQPDDRSRLQQLGVRTPYILSLVTHEPRKNLVSLVQAFNSVRSSGKQLQLVLAGGHGWKRRALDRAIASSPFRSNIVSLDYIADGDRPVLLRNALCLCLPSRYEGFGMQILEAMACGAPIVTTRNSSLHEVAGDAALYVRAMNVQELTDVLTELINDPVLQSQLREKSIERAKRFSWDTSAEAFVRFVK